jgi:hypothetical protein
MGCISNHAAWPGAAWMRSGWQIRADPYLGAAPSSRSQLLQMVNLRAPEPVNKRQPAPELHGEILRTYARFVLQCGKLVQ